jgi:hypothetical protein
VLATFMTCLRDARLSEVEQPLAQVLLDMAQAKLRCTTLETISDEPTLQIGEADAV